MSFVKDDHSFTRGVGAVAAMDAASPRRRAAATAQARKLARRDRIMAMRTLGALSFPTGPSTGVQGPHSIDVGWTGSGAGGLQTPTGPRGGGGSPGGGSPGGRGGHGPRGGGRGTSGGIVIPGGYQPRQPPGTKMPGSVVTTTAGGDTTQTTGGGTTTQIGPTTTTGGGGGGSSGGGDTGISPQLELECTMRGAPWYWDGSVCNQETTVLPPTPTAPSITGRTLLYGVLGAGAIWYFFLRGK